MLKTIEPGLVSADDSGLGEESKLFKSTESQHQRKLEGAGRLGRTATALIRKPRFDSDGVGRTSSNCIVCSPHTTKR